jgi:hypothetical protein
LASSASKVTTAKPKTNATTTTNNKTAKPSLLTTGTRVEVYWPDDDAYYADTVTKVRQRQHQTTYYLEYEEDGQCEWIDLSTETYRILSNGNASANDDPAAAAAAAGLPPLKQQQQESNKRRVFNSMTKTIATRKLSLDDASASVDGRTRKTLARLQDDDDEEDVEEEEDEDQWISQTTKTTGNKKKSKQLPKKNTTLQVPNIRAIGMTSAVDPPEVDASRANFHLFKSLSPTFI